MTEQELQALLESGNSADIDKALAYLDEHKEDVDAEPSSGKSGKQHDASTTQQNDVPTDSSTAGEDAIKGVQSKNGQHVLPYEVLEQARHEAQEAKRAAALLQEQLAQAQSKAESAESLQRTAQLLTEQLQKAGIKPAQLDADLTLTEEDLEALDEYGEVGQVSRKTAMKLRHLEGVIAQLQQQAKAITTVAAPESTQTPEAVANAIAAVDGLQEVMGHPTLSKQAIQLDDQLKGDPKWANAPLESRFTEVMRRLTPSIMKEGAAKSKAKEFDPDRFDPPMSLNGISNQSNATDAGLESMFNGLSEAEVQAKFLELSPAEQERAMRLLGW